MAMSDAGGTTLPLSKPIKAHGAEVSEILLRMVDVKDMIEIGQPFLIIAGDGETAVRIQNKTVAQYIVRLAQIPMSSVEQLAPADFVKAQAVVMGFFGEGDDVLASSSNVVSSS